MDHTRHIGIFDVSDLSVTIVGAGGIGAITAVTLAKMGVGYMNIIDGDVVSDVNLATQFHALESLDQPKVSALKREILRYADGTDIIDEMGRVEPDGILSGNIVIAAVDSIASRKAIWAAAQRGKPQWFLDARMAAEEFHLYSINMRADVGWYDRIISREDDSRVEELPCTAKATFFCGALSAAHLGATVRKIATGITPARYLVHNMIADSLITIPG